MCLPLDQCLSNQVCHSCRALLSAASKGVVFIAGFSLQKHYIATAFSTATIDGCPLFPVDSVWNHDISTLSVDRTSANYIASMGATGHVRAGFGAGLHAPVSQDWASYNAIFEALEGEMRVYLDSLYRLIPTMPPRLSP